MNKQEAVDQAKKLGYKWVAMDADGDWYGYNYQPKDYDKEWEDVEDTGFYLGLGRNSWRDTLTEVNDETET